MKFFILLAVIGLCRAGGFPIRADYAISTHGPDRSFTLVQKTEPMMAEKVMLTAPAARTFLTNDWDMAGRGMAIAARADIAGKLVADKMITDKIITDKLIEDKLIADKIMTERALIGRSAIATPLIANDWARKMTLAGNPLDLASKGLALGLAPTMSSTYVSRTFHNEPKFLAVGQNPLIEKSFIGAPIASPYGIAGKAMIAAQPMAFAERNWVADKMVSDKLVTDKLITDKLIAERSFMGSPILTERALLADKLMVSPKAMVGPLGFAEKSWFAPKTLMAAPMGFAEKSLIADKMIADKFVTDKLIADKLIAERSFMGSPFAVTGKTMMAAPVTFAEKAWMADKALMAAPMAVARNDWLTDKALIGSPFAAKTMFIKK